MPLMAVRVIDWSASFSFAPPSREAFINTDDVVTAVAIDPSRTRCMEPTMSVVFRDGQRHEIIGRPSDLVRANDGGRA